MKEGEEIVKIGRKMIRLGLVSGSSGNISKRISEDKIAITPTSIPYEEIKSEDIVILNLDGKVLEGKHDTSIEVPMHLAVYRFRQDVNGIVHTHSIYASALSCIGKEIPPIIDEQTIHLGGVVDVADYAIPGSEELAKNVVKSLKDKNAVLLRNHGTLCCGKDLNEALENAILTERLAKIYSIALMLGDVKEIPREAVELQYDLFKMKKTR